MLEVATKILVLLWTLFFLAISAIFLGILTVHHVPVKYKNNKPMNAILEEIEAKVEQIRLACGALCNPSNYQMRDTLKVARKDVNCKNIFKHQDLFESPHHQELDAPLGVWNLSRTLKDYYTLGGRVAMYDYYMDEQKHMTDDWNNGAKLKWQSKNIIDDLAKKAKNRSFFWGPYGDAQIDLVQGMKMMNLKGKTVLVVGSESPWVEILLLSMGTSKVDTLEYAKITTDHPKLRTFTPAVFKTAYENNSLPLYDAAVSFSTLEHTGMGRYGDGLNPWGDLLIMAKIWCVLKDHGKVLIGVPATQEDIICFNTHRIYGPLRFPLLFTNFEVKWKTEEHDHHVVLAEKRYYE